MMIGELTVKDRSCDSAKQPNLARSAFICVHLWLLDFCSGLCQVSLETLSNSVDLLLADMVNFQYGLRT